MSSPCLTCRHHATRDGGYPSVCLHPERFTGAIFPHRLTWVAWARWPRDFDSRDISRCDGRELPRVVELDAVRRMKK